MGDDTSFREVVDALTEPIWLADPDLETLRYVNPAVTTLLDRPVAATSPALDLREVVHPDDWPAVADWIETIRRDVETSAIEDRYEITVRVERPGGEVRWVDTVAVPIYDEAGAVSAVAGISADQTDREERERELAASVARLDEFASMVSHDLQNPVSVARGRLDLYLETGDREHLDAIDHALERIEALTRDLTTLARHGSLTADHEDVSIAEVAREAWAGIDTRDATLAVEDATVVGDTGQIRALLENLFRNAVGHGGNDVTVRVGPLVGGFFVEDTGRGIPEDARDRVFEHGYTTGNGGSGVGLTIVGRIADAHDMDVSLTESAEGGARFEFRPAE